VELNKHYVAKPSSQAFLQSVSGKPAEHAVQGTSAPPGKRIVQGFRAQISKDPKYAGWTNRLQLELTV